jgi:hypothetical protein
MLNETFTRTAKSAPYPPCTVTAFWLKYRDRDRMRRRVTQPPHIAGPLAQIFQYVTIMPSRRVYKNLS